MIPTLKQWSFGVLKHLGVSRTLARSGWRRNRLLILCYHGVSLTDEHLWEPGLYVPPAHLRRRLDHLRRLDCTVLPLDEALQRLYRGTLPDRAVALTFDDGYYDFGARVWPMLREYGYPATVYLTTGRVDHNLPNTNLFIGYTLWKARERVLDGDGLPGLAGRHLLDTPERRQWIVDRLNDEVRSDTASEKDGIAREIVVRLGLDYAALLESRVLTLLRPTEVARLAREGADFQLHTHVHRTPDDAEEFVADVLLNRDRIEAMTGQRAAHLCYPSGNYRAAYLPALRRRQIVSATTCDPGMASRRHDPLLLPRFVDTSSVTDLVFESWVTGVAPSLPRRTRRGGYTPPARPGAPSTSPEAAAAPRG